MENQEFKVGDLVYVRRRFSAQTWATVEGAGFIKELQLGAPETNKYHKALVTLTNGRSLWFPTSFIALKS